MAQSTEYLYLIQVQERTCSNDYVRHWDHFTECTQSKY